MEGDAGMSCSTTDLLRRTHIMKSLVYLVGILVCLVAMPVAAEDTTPANNMEIVRDAIRAEKKVLIAENMQLTEAEATAFWPVYDEYQGEQKKLIDRWIKLVEEYAANYISMTDEVAEKLMKESMSIKKDRLQLEHQYFPKFNKVISAKKTARYYQLENKIKAVVDYDLAAQIPLVD